MKNFNIKDKEVNCKMDKDLASGLSYVLDALLKTSGCEKKDNRFGGYIDIQNPINTYIKEIRVNKPAVIVFWNDGSKTVSICDDRDMFDSEKGILVCVLKKLLGNQAVSRLFKDWMEGFGPYNANGKRTLSDIRRKNRKSK